MLYDREMKFAPNSNRQRAFPGLVKIGNAIAALALVFANFVLIFVGIPFLIELVPRYMFWIGVWAGLALAAGSLIRIYFARRLAAQRAGYFVREPQLAQWVLGIGILIFFLGWVGLNFDFEPVW